VPLVIDEIYIVRHVSNRMQGIRNGGGFQCHFR
jgi:hypothetical protein